MRMEGVALLWFQSWCQDSFDASWTSFSIVLMRRIGARMKKTMPDDLLFNLRELAYISEIQE